MQRVAERRGGFGGVLLGPPGDVPVGADQHRADALHLAEFGPVAVVVAQAVAGADVVDGDGDAGDVAGATGGIAPALASDPGDEAEVRAGHQVQGGDPPARPVQPGVGEVGAGGGGGLVVQLWVADREGFGAAVGHDGTGAVAVAELDSVGVELVVHQRQGVAQAGAAPVAGGPRLVEPVEGRPAVSLGLVGREPERLLDGRHLRRALHGAVHHLASDRLALGAVALEQGRAGLTLDHQGQLPGEIEGVGDGRVESEPVGGWVPVHRVAHGQHAPGLVVAGHLVVDRPGGEALDDRRDRGVADDLADPLDGELVAMGDGLGGGVVGADHDELVPGPMADERAGAGQEGRAGSGVPVEDPRPVGQVAGQVGLEPHVDGGGESGFALDGEPGLFDDAAASSVGPDEVVAADVVGGVGGAVPHRGCDAVGVLGEGEELVAEPDVGFRPLPGRLEQHRFEHRLRAIDHRAGAGPAVVRRPVRAAAPGVEPRHLQAGQAGVPHVVGHQLVRGGDGVQAVLEAHVPEDLHRALVHDVGPGRVRRARVLLGQEVAHAVAGQQVGGGEPGRARSHDQHRDVDVGHHDSFASPWKKTLHVQQNIDIMS